MSNGYEEATREHMLCMWPIDPSKEVCFLIYGRGMWLYGMGARLASERLIFTIFGRGVCGGGKVTHISMYSGQRAIPTWFGMRRWEGRGDEKNMDNELIDLWLQWKAAMIFDMNWAGKIDKFVDSVNQIC